MWKKLKEPVQEWATVTIATTGIAGAVLVLRVLGLLQLAEWAALDRFFSLRPLESRDDRIVIVGIDETDIRQLGQWPPSDGKMAELLNKIQQQQPRAIGIDLYRDLPIEPGHGQLVEAYKTIPNLIGIAKVAGADGGFAVDPPPELRKRGQVGAADWVMDADGKVRRGLLFLETPEGEPIPSLGLMLALAYLETEGIEPKNAQTNPDYLQLGEAVFPLWRSNDGGYIKTDDRGYQVFLNYRGPKESFQMLSMSEVLENRIPSDLMSDRIVLIGAIAPSLQDFFNTPYGAGLITSPDRTAGVELHANLTSQIISATLDGRPLIGTWSESLECLWIALSSGVGALLGWKVRSFRWTGITILLAAGGFVIIAYGAFLVGWWIPVVPSVLALMGSSVLLTAYVAHLERQERQMVMNLFSRHVTPKIAQAIWRDRDQILEEGKIMGREMIATVLFTDLKGFSTVAENMDPKVLMAWLNDYMQAMTEVVLKNDGAIDKFIGDAIMAVFGVPIPSPTPEEISKEATASIRCALEMAEKLKSLNQQWYAQGKPTVAMRVGIATGTVVAGSLGSDQRLDYTILGDTVNIAARLESYDKSLDGGICRILISENTREFTEGFTTQLIGSVQLKGRKQETKVYQVLLD